MDESDEKTEQPTARRLEEARQKGNIARSADLAAAVALLGAVWTLDTFGRQSLEGLIAQFRRLGEAGDHSIAALPIWIFTALRSTGWILLPFLAVSVVLAILASGVQTRFNLAWARMQPDLGRLSPLNGLKRLFSGASAVTLLMGLAKMGLLGAVAWVTLSGRLGHLLAMGNVPAAGLLARAWELTYLIAIRMGLILLVLGVIDYFYQRWSVMRKLRMSKQEVKDEMKRMDGDPLMKQRRRQAQIKLMMQRIRMDVPKADVVVTNPTEYAVAIRYDERSMSAPRVVAKGKDYLALQIRLVAAEHHVPIVQRPALARALFASCEPGDEIPEAHYRAVAEVLAYVYRLEELSGQRARRPGAA
ncbi:MAG: Flagellar biosynthetic protein FlhB [Phycisphaerae bacterium]|nr:Flagellar biosynthetic protein FlhB [Phycisphaerae bacterium]